jgi:peptidyl-prolyl cis-trans isomerase B (cyclophilin B)
MAKFNYSQEEMNAPSEVKFMNESKKAETYMWDFGDGNKSSDANPAHKYFLSGKYEVVLEATKGNRTKKSKKELIVEAPKQCLVILSTEFGDMVIQLYDETPKHRDNFIKLAEEGFYDDLLFHRVIDGFMVQGGDPKSKGAPSGAPLGSGSNGYQIDAEFNPNLVHIKGALAAARTGGATNPKKKSSGCQFYIVDGKKFSEDQIKQFELEKGIKYSDEQKRILMEEGGTPFLDMEYTVFGQVIQGFDVIDAIAAAKKDRKDRPYEDISMKIIVIK